MRSQINQIKKIAFGIGRLHISLLFLVCLVLFAHCTNDDDTGKVPQTIKLTTAYNFESIKEGDFIVDFLFARDETLWIGTFKGGLLQVSGDDVTIFNVANSPLPHNHITDLFLDHLDRLWIATSNGFAKYDNGNWEVYTILNTPLVVDHVSEIAVNRKNEILIGNGNVIEGGLLFRTENGIWKNYNGSNSKLPGNAINEIELSGDDSFWVSTHQFQGKGGIAKFENETITEVLSVENSGLLYNHVDNIEIADQNIWIGYLVYIYNRSGVPDGGIQKVDLHSSSPTDYFPNDTDLVSNRITAMKLHSDNSLWFATGIDDPACENCFAGIGVLLDDQSFLAISTLNANLTSNAFFSKLNEDNQGNMYAASEKSLHRLELK